jgi:site-specific DNA recombinase
MTTTVSLRSAIYTRFSSDERDSDSCEVQERQARQAIEAQGWTVAPSFSDDGVSGREMVRRPGLIRLLTAAAAKPKPWDVCCVRDMDRLFRGDPARVLGILQQLQDQGVRIWEYTSRSFIEIDGVNVILTAVKAHANQTEALKASSRIKDKLKDSDEAGAFTVAAPYGWLNQRKHKHTGEIGVFIDRKNTFGVVVPHPDQFPILQLIAELFLESGTYNSVACELNRRQILDPGGTYRWAGQTVRAILVNPFYRGKIVRSRRVTVSRAGSILRVPNKPEDIREYHRPEFQAWDDETLKKIDAQIQARVRNTTWSIGARRHLASSFLRCPCGGTIVPTSSKRGPSYCCSRATGHACTAATGYRGEKVVDACLVEVCMSLLSSEVITRAREIITAALDVRTQHDTRLVERDRLTRDIATAEKRARAAEEMAMDSEGAERDRHRASLREQLGRLEALRGQFRELDAQEAPPDPRTLLDAFDARVKGLREQLGKGGLEALPAVQALLAGERLTVTRREDGRWELRGKSGVEVLYRGADVPRSQAVSLLVH